MKFRSYPKRSPFHTKERSLFFGEERSLQIYDQANSKFSTKVLGAGRDLPST